ncbi:MAG: FAD-dependent oxidoreductase [Deltaproteobacteria bacterium]|nr:FAD-dependent oxidoreductase [Deltaproteobacteria bacterium]
MNRKAGCALIVGGGISGMRAALDLAETGYGVTLVEQAPYLGGIVSQLDHQFPTNHCGMCRMLPLLDRESGSQHCLRKDLVHENIDIRLSTEVMTVAGEAGGYEVSLRKKPAGVDWLKCIGCGACMQACPVEVPDAFNSGLSKRKAIYPAAPYRALNSYRIDFSACTRCGACAAACPTGAVYLREMERKLFHVLVVDDELIVRDSIRELLMEEGYDADMAESGQEALNRLRESPFQLMLLDIKMPGMDGVEVLKKAKEIAPDVNVVMMTAYATVETAIEAMKTGALEYLIKPFEIDALMPMVEKRFSEFMSARDERIRVSAIVLAGGAAFFNPSSGKNTLGYGVHPNILTNLEFERLIGNAGPFAGRPIRSADKKPISRIAWIQCVGSRDLQAGADFCSSICCMISIKEALLAHEKLGPNLTTDIYYMDVRACGKNYHRYKEMAETTGKVNFIRGRAHTVVPDPDSGDLRIRYVAVSGADTESAYDLIVLAVGQRPHPDTGTWAEKYGLSLNAWGFAETTPFSRIQSQKQGILLAGSFSGLKDIRESVTHASAAALAASRVIHKAGGGNALVSAPARTGARNVSREPSRVLIVICSCDGMIAPFLDAAEIEHRLKKDPAVTSLLVFNRICAGPEMEALIQEIRSRRPNRLLIAAGTACADQVRDAGKSAGIHPSLIRIVEIRSPAFRFTGLADSEESSGIFQALMRILSMGISELKYAEPESLPETAVVRRAMVVGGGIAGMSAAIAIADHGYPVDLIERSGKLGGNLNWIRQTLEGHAVEPFLDEIRQKTEKHPRIQVYSEATVVSTRGEAGRFYSAIAARDNTVVQLEHGAVILATGGTEAPTRLYGHGVHPAVMTQKELEQSLQSGAVEPEKIETVVMIQCVGSREDPRNYCSRICCPTAIKQALYLKSQNPGLQIYVLYRDMMVTGFSESYYTRARKAGILFIPYTPGNKPRVETDEPQARVVVFEPIIDKSLEIEADIIVLATGIAPDFPRNLADIFEAERDSDGFFQEADVKWRPVDAMKPGLFGCGIVNSPQSIPDAIASAEAAAQRSLLILSRQSLPSGRITARVRHSLCSRCQVCIDACPYHARAWNAELERIDVNAAACQGCGACAAICPNSAAVVDGLLKPQFFEMIDACF